MTTTDTLTYDQYVQLCAVEHDADLRSGQWAFNVLYQIRPDLADAVRTTVRDPFYQDSKLPAFHEWVRMAW